MTTVDGQMTGIQLMDRGRGHGVRTAILSGGLNFSFDDLLRSSERVALSLLGDEEVVAEGGRQRSRDLEEERVAFLVPGSFDYVAVQWGIWRAEESRCP